MLKTLFVSSFLLIPVPQTPDVRLSSGDICTETNEDFVEYRYDEEIPYCKRNVLASLKSFVYDQYHIRTDNRGDYTVDHLIPLSLGGSNSLKNLWPEHKSIKAERHNLEYCLYLALKNGEINQRQAIEVVLDAKFHRATARQICLDSIDE